MAQATTIRGSQLTIRIGDGGDPEAFAHPCSINSERGIQFAAETRNNNVPDCDDPEAVVWQGTEKSSLSCTITGAGTLNASDQDIFFDWLESEDPKNVKVYDGISGASGGRIYTGAFHLTQFDKTGNFGEKVQVRITLVSDGVVTKSNAP
jgi:hypothetical protein